MIYFLGLDGLDYELVEEYKLPNLLQAEHGVLQVPISGLYKVPTSPAVWAAFLTGKLLQRILVTGLQPTRYPDLDETSFLDELGGVPINAPYYDMKNRVFDVIFDYKMMLCEDIIHELSKVYEYEKRYVLRKTRKLNDESAVFAYVHFPDALCHFAVYMTNQQIEEHYQDLDKFTGDVKDLVPESHFIIVSDHGFNFDGLCHSRWGYYSSSKPLEPKPKRITYFCEMLCGRRTLRADKPKPLHHVSRVANL